MSQLLYTVRPALTSTAAALVARDAITSGTDWSSAIIHNTSDANVNIGVAGVTNSTGFTLEPGEKLELTDLDGADDVFELYGITASTATIQVLLGRR
jgi:hypothetical protein